MKKETFDSIIKQNLVNKYGSKQFGYKIANKIYENYYTDSVFDDFVKEMKSPKYIKYHTSYDKGKGSELKKQNGRYGEVPPKMASVASSSRFCYLALRDGTDALGVKGTVQFEKGCRIKGIEGTAPQLDAHIPEGNIYIEAKCHEIFDSHTVNLKAKYWELIYGETNEFGFEVKDNALKGDFKISLSCFGIQKSNTRFDIKQFLCHLLGIASQKEADISATLMYLFFKPKTENIEYQKAIDEVFEDLIGEIELLFTSEPIQKFVEKNNIKLCAVAESAKIMEPLTKSNMIVLV